MWSLSGFRRPRQKRQGENLEKEQMEGSLSEDLIYTKVVWFTGKTSFWTSDYIKLCIYSINNLRRWIILFNQCFNIVQFVNEKTKAQGVWLLKWQVHSYQIFEARVSKPIVATFIGLHDRVKTEMIFLYAIPHFLQNEHMLPKCSLLAYPKRQRLCQSISISNCLASLSYRAKHHRKPIALCLMLLILILRMYSDLF